MTVIISTKKLIVSAKCYLVIELNKKNRSFWENIVLDSLNKTTNISFYMADIFWM